MSQQHAPETYRQLLQLLIKLLTEPEDETTDDVNEYLRDAGYDPDKVAARLQLRIRQALDTSPLNWRNKSAQIQTERKRLHDIAPMLSGDITQLKGEISRLLGLLGNNSALALHHRKLNLDDMTEEDLAQLCRELEYQLAHHKSRHDAEDQ